MRTIIAVMICLLSVGLSASAFAEDRELTTAEAQELAATGAQSDTDMVVETSATSILLAAFRPSAFARPQKSIVLRKATKSVVRAVKSGLVLLDVDLKGGDSRVYVKFGTDGMPRLRWQTRF